MSVSLFFSVSVIVSHVSRIYVICGRKAKIRFLRQLINFFFPGDLLC